MVSIFVFFAMLSHNLFNLDTGPLEDNNNGQFTYLDYILQFDDGTPPTEGERATAKGENCVYRFSAGSYWVDNKPHGFTFVSLALLSLLQIIWLAEIGRVGKLEMEKLGLI